MLHENETKVIPKLNSENDSSNGFRSRSRQHVLRTQKLKAERALYYGNLEEYMELCVLEEKWDKALAIAPAMGIETWQNLCQS